MFAQITARPENKRQIIINKCFARISYDNNQSMHSKNSTKSNNRERSQFHKRTSDLFKRNDKTSPPSVNQQTVSIGETTFAQIQYH